MKHIVSRELILYFDKIKDAILKDDNDQETVLMRKSALESVRSDPGLHQLVPYFVQFVAEKVTHSLNNLFVLQQMMELTQAIIENKSLHVDPYVTSLAPAILTCLVGRKLGSGATDSEKEVYQLRDLASSLIGYISNRFSRSSSELQSRLARTCLKVFLDPTRSVGEHYGAINGIRSIGGRSAVQQLMLPNLKSYEYILNKIEGKRGSDDTGYRMLLAALMKAVTSLVDDSAPMSNGMNGSAEGEGQLVEEYLGPIIGKRVANLGNHKLNTAVLESKDKESS